MSTKSISKLSSLIGATAIVATTAMAVTSNAAGNPFTVEEMSSGYNQVIAEGKCGEGKCGEGKCGGDKAEGEGKCGEGKCGEGKCGEGKCGEA